MKTSDHSIAPWHHPPHAHYTDHSAIIIGGGIAGAATAFYLAHKGWKVTLLERHNELAAEGSGNYQGILYAKLSAHATAQSQLLLAGYYHTLALLNRYLTKGENWDNCGILNLSFNEHEAHRNAQLATKPFEPSLCHLVTQSQAEKLANIPLFSGGLFFPDGGWVHPAALIRLLVSHPNIEYRLSTQVLTLTKTGKNWQVADHHIITQAPVVVLATAYDSLHFQQTAHFPLIPLRGQTTVVDSTTQSQALKIVLSGKGYISPAWKNKHCFGATALINNRVLGLDPLEHQENFQQLKLLSPSLYQAMETELGDFSHYKGHAAIRCSTPDRLPLVGPVVNTLQFRANYAQLAIDKNIRFTSPCPWLEGLFVNIGHGTRGLLTAPICGELIAAYVTGSAFPFSDNMVNVLNPNRFLVRQMTRGL